MASMSSSDSAALRAVAWQELGRNAGPPALCYPLFVLICAVASDYGHAHPLIVAGFTLLLTIVGAVRAWSGHRLVHQQTAHLERLLALSTLLSAALWSAYTTSAIVWFGYGWTSQLMVIMSVGLSAGGTSTLGPDLRLMRGFVGLQLLPPVVALLSYGSRESFSAIVVLAYAIFLFSIGRRQNAFYWNALRDNQLLRQRSGELEIAKSEAEHLSQRNQSILNSAGDGIVGLDTQGLITFINPAVARMTGRPAEHLVGQAVSAWLSIDRPQQSAASCILDTCARGVEHRVTGACLRRDDGTSLMIDFVATPIREDGQVVGAVMSLADVTQRYELDRLKDQFVSTVSHELRTPLTSIRGSLGMLASGQLEGKPDAARRMMEIASANTERLVRLINDVLDLQKIQQGGLLLDRKRWGVTALLELARDNVLAYAQSAQVKVELTPLDAEVWVDADRLLQALINLLSNAVKFSDQGQTVRLSARLLDPDGKVEICVADEGIGIEADMQERIFNEFFQVDGTDSRSKGGTGLGLAISRRLVEAHGGRLWVESEPHHGSRFYLTVPRAALAADPVHRLP